MKKTQQKERYLIINPGRPGIRKVKKVSRKVNRKNPGSEDIIESIDVLRERLGVTPISDKARHVLRKCLVRMNAVLISEGRGIEYDIEID